MNKGIFQDTIHELHEYFRKDNLPSSEVMRLWWEKCNYIPDRFMVDICNLIEEQNERLPTNIPKVMKALYVQLAQGQTKGKDDYKKDDDPDFPIVLMHRARRILNGDRGNIAAFNLYCDEVGMPKADRERILAAEFRRFRLVQKSDDLGVYYDLYDGDKFVHSGRGARKLFKTGGGDLTFSGMEV